MIAGSFVGKDDLLQQFQPSDEKLSYYSRLPSWENFTRANTVCWLEGANHLSAWGTKRPD